MNWHALFPMDNCYIKCKNVFTNWPEKNPNKQQPDFADSAARHESAAVVSSDDDTCQYFTLGACTPSDEETIDSYNLPNTTVSNHHLCHAYNQKFPFDPHRNNPQALSRPPAEFPTIVCKILSLELHALFGVSFGGSIMIIDHHCIVRIVMIMLMM